MFLRLKPHITLLAVILFSGCAYYNTFYNAQEYYNEAEKLRGLKLFINRNKLSKLSDDEFYQVDLLGFEVYNLKRESFGSIISFNDFGGGLLVEVNKNDKMFYLPMSSNFLKDINYIKKEVVLNLDLNFIED